MKQRDFSWKAQSYPHTEAFVFKYGKKPILIDELPEIIRIIKLSNESILTLRFKREDEVFYIYNIKEQTFTKAEDRIEHRFY